MTKNGLIDRDRALLFGDDQLQEGDAVVHFEHGLASYGGRQTVQIEGEDQTLHVFIYRNGGKLMLPAIPGRDFWPYGAPAGDVTLDRLNADDWVQRRDKMIAELRDGAQSLIDADQVRRAKRAHGLLPPEKEMAACAAKFGYDPTPDQKRAIDAVLVDLSRDVAMDRLLIGDVGFGKTEVAIRAAAAAIYSGYQVAFAAPTTVLARQHAQSLRDRFGNDIVVELSRLTSGDNRSEILGRIKGGDAKIIVGTQALLAEDLSFANLALVVIDEEQRFGRDQKHNLRALADGVHVLSMTATPIPRSLAAAEIGLVSVSVVATAPLARKPVEVYLAEFNWPMIAETINDEVKSGGQVYFVCPRIEDLKDTQAILDKHGDDFSYALAHGQMDEEKLDARVSQFMKGEVDLLLSTTIIESGLDNPCANTMIVINPELFGLAQLHQLRGRIGRGEIAAKMVLVTDLDLDFSDDDMDANHKNIEAVRRLKAFTEMSDIGAGFRIAREDRNMRGFGQIDGDAQSGYASRLGIGLYQHILRQYAVAE